MSGFTHHYTLVLPSWEHTRRFNLDDFMEINGVVHVVTRIDRGKNIVSLTEHGILMQEIHRNGLRVVVDPDTPAIPPDK